MANLASYQKISRVIPDKDFGDGISGAATISSDPNTRATFAGTSGQTTGTAGSTAFANGDLVLLHKTQSINNAGQWEINMVVSGGGTTSLTFKVAHEFTYDNDSQIIKVPRYSVATISNHSVTAWNGTTGAVEVICAKSLAGTATITLTGLGYVGGGGGNPTAVQGEGYTGTGTNSIAANTSGGGGGNKADPFWRGGGGGGNGTAGTATAGAAGGGTSGSADLLLALPGGGGGGGYNDSGPSGGVGGKGGGVLFIFAKSIPNTITIANNGADGTGNAGGGGGAGGSILLVCETGTLGTITANGGAGGVVGGEPTRTGGAGGVGRIAIHHSGTVTGTTTPTFTDVSDTSLVDLDISNRGYFYFM